MSFSLELNKILPVSSVIFYFEQWICNVNLTTSGEKERLRDLIGKFISRVGSTEVDVNTRLIKCYVCFYVSTC